jgi:AcrR family transcriptional regulator
MNFNSAMTATSLRRTPKSRPRVLRQALQEHTRAAYREAILAAAERIILRDGFQPARMADIADATGVSVGTLYNYFESKEAVFNALVEHHRGRFIAQVERPFDSEDPLLQLRELVARTHEFAEENGGLFNLYMRTRIQGVSVNETGCVVRDIDHHRIQLHLERLLAQAQEEGKIRSDVPVGELVWALESLLYSLLMDWARQPSNVSLKKRGDEVVTLFLQGACIR